MLFTSLIYCLVVVARVLAASSLTHAQSAIPAAKVLRIQLGCCDQHVVYNLPAQRFDQTARAILAPRAASSATPTARW
jgi:hypothetical protein